MALNLMITQMNAIQLETVNLTTSLQMAQNELSATQKESARLRTSCGEFKTLPFF
jgi:hypothetical protein